MSIVLIYQKGERQKLWLDALKKELPKTQIEVYPDIRQPSEVEFLISMTLDNEHVESFPNLKVIQSFGAGVDQILKSKLLRDDMILSKMVDEYLCQDMFEFVFTAIAAHLKNIPSYIENQRQKIWKPKKYKRFRETTVSILGLGMLGSYVAKKLAENDFMVRGWSNSLKNIEKVESFVGFGELENCINGVDILVNLLPATSSTAQILNKKNLEYLSKGAFLINVGRGIHSDEEDIIALLDNGHLSGALIDVFDEEPLPLVHPFWEHEKVIVTPHMASQTNPYSAAKLIAENYRRFKMNQPLLHVVDRTRGY